MRALAWVVLLSCFAWLGAGPQVYAQSRTPAELGALYKRAASYFQSKDYARALTSCDGDGVVSLAFSPDSNKLISGSIGDSAIIWDVEQGTPLHRLEGHGAGIYAVGFTPDGARAVTGSGQTLRLWRVADGILLKERKGLFADEERKGQL